jgi:4-hydroxy-4-methyl-2-oxoglutarate aldolase
LRYPVDVLARLAPIDTSTVADALDRLGLSGVAAGIHRLSSHTRIVARVRTVQLGPSTAEPPPASRRHLATSAIELAAPGDVIVIANEGRTAMAAWGELLTVAALARGITGVVIDGMCRDLDECRAAGFPVFAKGAVPTSARGRVVEVASDVAVRIAGVEVRSGDIVVADASGVVFIASEQLDGVIAESERLIHRESEMRRALAAGHSPTTVLDRRYEDLLRDQ